MIRRGKVLWLLAAGGVTAVASLAPPAPRWIWNATASAPEGLYALRRHQPWGRHDLVAIQSPPPLADWLSARGYAPAGVLLIKRVAALAPSTVCRDGGAVTIDRTVAARAEAGDHAGRPLPRWSGCRALGADEVFLLNPAKGSVDSRYFGPLPRTSVVGPVTPAWLIPDARHGR